MANGIKIGGFDFDALKIGGDDVDAAYIGDTLLYPQGQPPTPTFDGKWLATYSGGTTSSAECDASSAITSGEVTTTGLVSIEIGNCVTSIANRAFYNCKSLTSITIPDSVTSIGEWVFYGCSGLTSIDVLDNVTTIGKSAIRDCNSLSTITIGTSITSIGSSAFYRCTGLTSIIIEATTPPSIGTLVFENTNDCPIYVPSGSVSAYQSAWSEYEYSSRIQAIPNI